MSLRVTVYDPAAGSVVGDETPRSGALETVQRDLRDGVVIAFETTHSGGHLRCALTATDGSDARTVVAEGEWEGDGYAGVQAPAWTNFTRFVEGALDTAGWRVVDDELSESVFRRVDTRAVDPVAAGESRASADAGGVRIRVPSTSSAVAVFNHLARAADGDAARVVVTDGTDGVGRDGLDALVVTDETVREPIVEPLPTGDAGGDPGTGSSPNTGTDPVGGRGVDGGETDRGATPSGTTRGAGEAAGGDRRETGPNDGSPVAPPSPDDRGAPGGLPRTDGSPTPDASPADRTSGPAGRGDRSPDPGGRRTRGEDEPRAGGEARSGDSGVPDSQSDYSRTTDEPGGDFDLSDLPGGDPFAAADDADSARVDRPDGVDSAPVDRADGVDSAPVDRADGANSLGDDAGRSPSGTTSQTDEPADRQRSPTQSPETERRTGPGAGTGERPLGGDPGETPEDGSGDTARGPASSGGPGGNGPSGGVGGGGSRRAETSGERPTGPPESSESPESPEPITGAAPDAGYELRLFEGATGRLAFSTEREAARTDDRTRWDHDNGTTLVLDPRGGYARLAVRARREGTESFLAEFRAGPEVVPPERLLATFRDTLAGTLDRLGWHPVDADADAQLVYAHAVDAGPFDPGLEGDLVDLLQAGPVDFAVPTYTKAIELFQWVRERAPEGTAIVICEAGRTEVTDGADVVIRPDEDVTTVRVVGEATERIERRALEPRAAAATDALETVAEAVRDETGPNDPVDSYVAELLTRRVPSEQRLAFVATETPNRWLDTATAWATIGAVVTTTLTLVVAGFAGSFAGLGGGAVGLAGVEAFPAAPAWVQALVAVATLTAAAAGPATVHPTVAGWLARLRAWRTYPPVSESAVFPGSRGALLDATGEVGDTVGERLRRLHDSYEAAPNAPADSYRAFVDAAVLDGSLPGLGAADPARTRFDRLVTVAGGLVLGPLVGLVCAGAVYAGLVTASVRPGAVAGLSGVVVVGTLLVGATVALARAEGYTLADLP
ncbi:hypothetical protein RYH80_02370 [Halobaculum sp. MBLA0147]|uniref:hypothetical protein n=1 Tax=Halobaculum sp. MBLA0147 TaxID=3079934 RepID=UPI003523D041